MSLGRARHHFPPPPPPSGANAPSCVRVDPAGPGKLRKQVPPPHGRSPPRIPLPMEARRGLRDCPGAPLYTSGFLGAPTVIARFGEKPSGPCLHSLIRFRWEHMKQWEESDLYSSVPNCVPPAERAGDVQRMAGRDVRRGTGL